MLRATAFIAETAPYPRYLHKPLINRHLANLRKTWYFYLSKPSIVTRLHAGSSAV